MKRLFILALVALAAWYGWKHWTDLRKVPRDEVVISNESGRGLLRVRLSVGGETYVRETIPDGGKATFPFPVTGDGSLGMTWQYAGEEADKTWSGGQVAAGPVRTRHIVRVMGDGGIVWTPETIRDARH